MREEGGEGSPYLVQCERVSLIVGVGFFQPLISPGYYSRNEALLRVSHALRRRFVGVKL